MLKVLVLSPMPEGGMERMVVYPVLVWSIAFGGHMMALEDPAKA